MDKKLIAALTGASALALLGGAADAAPGVADLNRLQPAQSFSELLNPIANATEVLKAEDQAAQEPEARVELARFHHHHHHHHHHFRHHHHHHHHHHHFGRRHRDR